MEQRRARAAEPGPEGARWCADPAARPVWRHWGDAHYAFDPRSHQTHFLNTLAVEIFELLRVRPMGTAEIAHELTDGYAMEDTPELREAVAATLNVLERLGLLLRHGAG
jgi:PqqD family protein of HPr-rel-A system